MVRFPIQNLHFHFCSTARNGTILQVGNPDGSSLWLKSVLWASEGFNRSATAANSGMLSPHEVFFGGRPPMPVLPFCKPACHHVPRRSKMDPQARPCFFLNFGYNHRSDCYKIMDAETGRVVPSRDVTLHQSRERLFPRPRQLDRECPIYHPVPKRRTTYISSRHLQLLPRLPPLQLPPRRCLHQPSLHPRCYQTPQHQFPITLFGNRGTRWTCVCLDAREEKRAR